MPAAHRTLDQQGRRVQDDAPEPIQAGAGAVVIVLAVESGHHTEESLLGLGQGGFLAQVI